MTDNEKDIRSDIQLLKNIHIFKKIIPSSSFSFSIILSLRFIGIFIFFNNLTNLPNNFIISLLRVLCIFQDFSRPNITSYYEIYCFFTYLVTFFPLVLFAFAYFSRNNKSKNDIKIKTKKHLKTILKISGFSYFIILIGFQHLIEVLTFGYFSYIISQNPSSNNLIVQTSFFTDFIKNLTIPIEFYMTVNSICILILNFYLFISFYILNEPYFKSTGSFNLKISKFHTLFLIVLFNFQGIHYIDLIFHPNTIFTVKIVIFIIFIVFFLVILFENTVYFNFHNFPNSLCIWLLSMGFFFAVIEIGLYVISNNNLESSVKAIFRLIVINFLTICLLRIVSFIKHWRFIFNLEKSLISNIKGLNIEALFYLISLLKESLDDYKKLHHIYELFIMHKSKCLENIKCICRSLDMERFKNFIHIIHKTEENNYTKKVLKFNLHFQEFLNLIEMGIINLTDLNNNNDQNYLLLILLHIDFIYFFKNSQLLSNYAAGKYLVINQTIPFITKYYMYCYKVNLIKESQKFILNHSYYTHYYNLMKYINNFQKIDMLMLNYSEHIHSLIKIRDFYNNFKDDYEDEKNNEAKKNFFNSNESFKIDEVIKICGKIKKCLNNLKEKVKKDYKKDICRNVEMSYKLNNFFLLFNKGVPIEMKYYFLQIENCEPIIKADFTFLETDFIHPMIINVEFNDLFPIRYVSQKFCKEIEYEPNELIGKDFHILIPNFFHKQHLKILNDSIFRHEQTDRQKSVYLISKNKHYIPISFSASFFPSFRKNISMVLNFQPITQPEPNEFIFLINLDAKMICFSKNFENKYYLNSKIFTKLNINFLSLFDINIDKIEEYYNKDIQKCTKKQLNNNPNEDPLDDERISFINKNKKSINKEDLKKEAKVVYKSKSVLYNNIVKIKKTVTELELDEEYFRLITLLENKLNVTKKFNSNITLSQININPIKNNVNNELKNEIDIKPNSIEEFKIKILLKNVGTVPYLYVNLTEENTNSTCANSEIHTNQTTSKSLSNHFKDSKIDLKFNHNSLLKHDQENKNKDMSLKRNSIFNISTESLIRKNLNSTQMLQDLSFSNINKITSKCEEINPNIPNNSKLDSSNLHNKDISIASLTNRNEGNITFKTSMKLLQKPETKSVIQEKKSEKDKKKVRNHKVLYNKTDFMEEMNYSISVDAASVYIKRNSGQKLKTFKISKDTIEEKTSKEKKNLSVLFIFLILVGISCIYNFFHKNERIDYIRKLFELYHSNLVMKSSVIFLSNNIINLYILSSNLIPFNIDNITISQFDLLNKINFYSNVLVKEKHYFEHNLIDLGYLSDDISIMLNETIKFNYLFDNWQSYKRDNNLISELYRFNEISSSILYENFTENPNFKSFFLANSKKNMTKSAELKDSAAFYVLNNVIGDLLIYSNLLSKKVFNFMIQGHVSSKNEVILYHCVVLMINIMLFIVLYFMITNSQEKILDMILIIISLKRNFDENIIVKIESFKNLLTNFCDDKVLEFEKQKVIRIIKDSEEVNKIENDKSQTKINEQKKKMNYDTYKSLPIKVVTYAKVCLFIAFMVFLLLILINLFVDIKLYNELIISNIISANYLERIPLITELYLYYQFSVVMNKTDLIEIDQPLSEKKSLNIYEYISSGNNEFININNYFETSQQNIQTYINQYSYLTSNTLRLEKNLQSENLCAFLNTLSQDILDSFYNNSNLEYYKKTNISTICLNCGKGINQKGLNQALQAVQNSLKEKYSEFKNYLQKDQMFILNLLGDNTHLLNMIEVNFILETIHMIFARMVNQDLMEFYDYLRNLDTIFNILGLVLNSLLIFYIIMGIFKYLQNYYDDLDFSSKKFKKAVSQENKT